MIASLGTFGGTEIRKNTGGVQKSIPLFQVKQGDISYSPTLEYFSTGIKVDDWGSRVGMGWTDNITAVITRTVRHIPDETATSRFGDGPDEFLDPSDPVNAQNALAKARQLSSPTTKVDGIFDEFHYNIMGTSGGFIIRKGQAVLLKDNNEFKVSIISTSPTYQFILTDIGGTKYYFTSSVEKTKFDADNPCDNDNPNTAYTATAWFVDKMVSPGGRVVNFYYSDLSFNYLYDFNESYIFSEVNDLPYDPCSEGSAPSGTRSYCLRRKLSNTKLLSSVTADNFSLTFDYITRNDIYAEKLLSKVTLKNNDGEVRSATLKYDEVVATSTLELIIANSLTNDPVEEKGLKTRYYLKSLEISDSKGKPEQLYQFTYFNPGDLPHRYSLSQDYLGYYNGQINVSLVPKISLIGEPQLFIDATRGITFGNRDPSLAGRAGLLSNITYPTGAKDDITYEQNKYHTIVENIHTASVKDWYSCEEWPSYSGGFFTMNVPMAGPVTLFVECYYGSDEPMTKPVENYEADFELWSSDGIVTFPSGQTRIQLQLNKTFNSTNILKGQPIKLMMEPDKEYWLNVNIYGKNTTLRATLEYITSITNDPVDSVYMGYRVKNVVTHPLAGPDLVKSYNYNTFKVTGNQLALSNESSLNVTPLNNFRTEGLWLCEKTATNGVPTLSLLKLMGKSNYNLNEYAGVPYTYSCITEFQDASETAFISSEMAVSRDTREVRIIDDGKWTGLEITYPALNNSSWNNGIELNRYYGAKIDGKYNVDRRINWDYLQDEKWFFTYSAYQLLPVIQGFSDPRSNLGFYMIKSGAVYTHYVKLNSMTETNFYPVAGGGYNTGVNKTLYRYAGDKLKSEEETTSSKGEVLLKHIARPYEMMNTTGKDPQGIYAAMVNNHIVAPEIEVANNRDGNQVSLVRTNYFQPFTGLFLPQSIQTQSASSDPLVTNLKYLKYDDMGNILSLSENNGKIINYIWSYKGIYPVAKIENCDYSTLESVIGSAALTSFRGLNPDDVKVEQLIAPVRTNVPGAFITRYTYTPLVGVNAIMDNKGQMIYYNYDNFQRLKTIKDTNGKVIKSFFYHYGN
ncbi:hypothetical protein [Chitinophaga ginsengisoli]|nr:hypothetical protein [Chitinophaga ginsengisoli]